MKKYFYSIDSDKHGPFTLEELQDEGINEDTLIWFEGLDDWTRASHILELKPILELIPPPLPDSEYINNDNTKSDPDVKKASTVWIIFGFIFAFLGGFLGLLFGFTYAFGKYDKSTKNLGWLMLFIGIASMFLWTVLK